MAWQRTGTISRGARVGIVAVLAMPLLALGPLDARADSHTVSATIGGGVVHGIVTFGGDGLDPECEVDGVGDHLPFTVDAWAPNFTYNTVITGFVGVVHVTGGGTSRCADGPVRTGTVNLTLTGTGPTGSELDCSVGGNFQDVGTVVTVLVSGSCTINEWDESTSEIRFVSTLNFIPFDPVGSGLDDTKNIRRAWIDGPFSVLPV